MTELFSITILRLLFYPSLTFDYIIVTSFIFAFAYPGAMLLASFIPRRWNAIPNALGLPLLFGVCALLPFTNIGIYCGFTLHFYLGSMIGAENAGVTWDPYLPCVCFLIVWYSGIIACVAKAGKNSAALRRLLRSAAAVKEDPVFTQALRALHMDMRVQLKESPDIAAAGSWRLAGAMVLIPAGFMDHHAPEERYAIYLHELTHIRNRDSYKILALAFLKTLFWFNPVFLHAARRYRNHMEIACDRAVIRQRDINRHVYAGLMVAALNDQYAFMPGFSSAYQETARRLRYVFNDHSILPARPDRLTATCCLAAALFAIFCYTGNHEEVLPWGKTSLVPDENGEMVPIHVTFYWHGMLGSYIIASDVPGDAGQASEPAGGGTR